MNTKKFIKLYYQVPNKKHKFGNTCNTTYEVKTCYTEVNESLSDKENLDKAFEMAFDLGADPNKLCKWTVISETEYIKEVFDSIRKDIPTLCRNWGKKNGSCQFLYGDVLDWIRDMHNEIYRSSSCTMFARMIIGEYVITETIL